MGSDGISVRAVFCVQIGVPPNTHSNSKPVRSLDDLRTHRQCSTLMQGEASDKVLTSRSTHRKPSATATELDVPNWVTAIRAAESKKALDLVALDLREITSFTDYFIICSVSNPRQAHAVSDEVSKQLKQIGELPISAEGYEAAEWILLDYGDFIVHIFSETARAYYDLERLWRHAKRVNLHGHAV